MYDELVKRLWECASGECFNCSQYTPTTNASVCQKELMKQAADAIEEIATNYDAATDIMKHQTEYIEELEAKLPRWIPVTERLPEDLTRAIVFCEDGVSFGLCEHLIADDTEVVEWHDFLHYPITPTHWMPLPEPPKEENMRNRDRIRPFCERLAGAWEKCPDMRFGQFICNVYATELKRDPFFIKDDESMRLIEKCANECSPYHKPPKEE